MILKWTRFCDSNEERLHRIFIGKKEHFVQLFHAEDKRPQGECMYIPQEAIDDGTIKIKKSITVPGGMPGELPMPKYSMEQGRMKGGMTVRRTKR
jgi:hypothetical protein